LPPSSQATAGGCLPLCNLEARPGLSAPSAALHRRAALQAGAGRGCGDHVDIKQDEGVDLSATGRPGHRPGLVRHCAAGVRSVLCSNLLEHVDDRRLLCAAPVDPPAGGLILPRSAPYPTTGPLDTSTAHPPSCTRSSPARHARRAVLDCGTLIDNRASLELREGRLVPLPFYNRGAAGEPLLLSLPSRPFRRLRGLRTRLAPLY